MKKIIFVLICLLCCFSLCACDSIVVKNNENSASLEQQETKKDLVQEVKSGDKIVTNYMEVAINKVELTYDVLPDDISGFYTHYAADVGKVYISIDASVTNKAKQKLGCDTIGRVVANYNDGYTYDGFIIVKDSTTGFTYANITSIDPLETTGIKWLIECPQEIDESDKALFLEFTINGEKFIYHIR